MPIRIGYLHNEVLWAFLEFLVPCMYMEQWENWDNYGKIVFCTTCSVVKEEAGAGVLRAGTYTEEKTGDTAAAHNLKCNGCWLDIITGWLLYP